VQGKRSGHTAGLNFVFKNEIGSMGLWQVVTLNCISIFSIAAN